MAIETSGGQRLLVATDQVGSPVLVFRQDGSVLKELEYSAFGRIMLDGNPSLSIPVGFHGGLVLPHSSMLYMPRYFYLRISRRRSRSRRFFTQNFPDLFQ